MAERQEKHLIYETPLWSDYQNALEDQIRSGLRDKIPTCIDFYEGRQWPEATESTKNLPRPVVNIIKMVCRQKKGAILSSPVKISYKSFSPNADMENFNAFAERTFKELNQAELDRHAIEDAIKKGSYFYHYYWDSESVSNDTGEIGGLRCELINPLNIFFSNPAELDEQKQDWILISSRMELSKIKSLADDGKSLSNLTADDTDSFSFAPKGKNKATLLTRYFKKDGEVWCERATKHCIINDPFKIIPESIDLSEKTPWEEESRRNLFRPNALYPIVSGYYEKKEGSIYGIGEVEGLIPNQKAINFNIAMSLLNAQQCAWGKYIALPNALNGQRISNVPGQVLIDYSGTGDGIKRISQDELSKVPMELTMALADLTRSVNGVSSIITGDSASGLSGTAIAYLQSQAEVPIEDLRNAFIFVKRKQGLVVAQFLKHFYYKCLYIKESMSAQGEKIELFEEFSSLPYQNAYIDVCVEAYAGKKASIASDISLLNNCLEKGAISLETYIKAYPDSAITNKGEILKYISKEKEI